MLTTRPSERPPRTSGKKSSFFSGLLTWGCMGTLIEGLMSGGGPWRPPTWLRGGIPWDWRGGGRCSWGPVGLSRGGGWLIWPVGQRWVMQKWQKMISGERREEKGRGEERRRDEKRRDKTRRDEKRDEKRREEMRWEEKRREEQSREEKRREEGERKGRGNREKIEENRKTRKEKRKSKRENETITKQQTHTNKQTNKAKANI